MNRVAIAKQQRSRDGMARDGMVSTVEYEMLTSIVTRLMENNPARGEGPIGRFQDLRPFLSIMIEMGTSPSNEYADQVGPVTRVDAFTFSAANIRKKQLWELINCLILLYEQAHGPLV